MSTQKKKKICCFEFEFFKSKNDNNFLVKLVRIGFYFIFITIKGQITNSSIKSHKASTINVIQLNVYWKWAEIFVIILVVKIEVLDILNFKFNFLFHFIVYYLCASLKSIIIVGSAYDKKALGFRSLEIYCAYLSTLRPIFYFTLCFCIFGEFMPVAIMGA